jgi:putative transposase
MDSQLFEFWFENSLLPELTPGCAIVMDNASFHRKKCLALFAQNAGHKLVFLPPYSPEYNPIEKFWAWLKGKLKKVLSCFDSFDESLCYCFNCI